VDRIMSDEYKSNLAGQFNKLDSNLLNKEQKKINQTLEREKNALANDRIKFTNYLDERIKKEKSYYEDLKKKRKIYNIITVIIVVFSFSIFMLSIYLFTNSNIKKSLITKNEILEALKIERSYYDSLTNKEKIKIKKAINDTNRKELLILRKESKKREAERLLFEKKELAKRKKEALIEKRKLEKILAEKKKKEELEKLKIEKIALVKKRKLEKLEKIKLTCRRNNSYFKDKFTLQELKNNHKIISTRETRKELIIKAKMDKEIYTCAGKI
jgi:hypothetical protein